MFLEFVANEHTNWLHVTIVSFMPSFVWGPDELGMLPNFLVRKKTTFALDCRRFANINNGIFWTTNAIFNFYKKICTLTTTSSGQLNIISFVWIAHKFVSSKRICLTGFLKCQANTAFFRFQFSDQKVLNLNFVVEN